MELKEVVKYVSELRVGDYISCFDGIWCIFMIIYLEGCVVRILLDSIRDKGFNEEFDLPKDLKIVTVDYVEKG
jgi:hypothetical protein